MLATLAVLIYGWLLGFATFLYWLGHVSQELTIETGLTAVAVAFVAGAISSRSNYVKAHSVACAIGSFLGTLTMLVPLAAASYGYALNAVGYFAAWAFSVYLGIKVGKIYWPR